MLLPTRTRQNVKQSKNGCFACRAQRKKCDEGKPQCLRCARSERKCESFADSSPTPSPAADVLKYSPSPERALSTQLRHGPVQSRFLDLGITVLKQQASHDAFGIGSTVWTYLLPQLSSFNSTINAAIASLGATYEAIVLQPVQNLYLEASPATFQYHKAIALLRSDLTLQSQGPLVSFLTSIILAAVEGLLRNFTNALMHLQGAFTILTKCMHLPAAASSPAHVFEQGDCVISIDDGRSLYLIAQALDIQTATFSLSRAPDLPSALPFTNSDVELGSLLRSPYLVHAQSELISLLHTCYSYTKRASEYRYVPRSAIPADIALDQSRHIARLSQWLSKHDYSTSQMTEPGASSRQLTSSSSSPLRPQLLILRIQCISTLIYLSVILDYHETAYDAFQSFFQQIVDCAALVLENQTSNDCFGNSQNRFQFISPVSQPLYLTAMKCRHGAVRRKAIRLLGITGREGPWNGLMSVKISQRAMEIEEEQSFLALALRADPEVESTASSLVTVAEDRRLHGCGIDSDAARLPGHGFIVAYFSRCVDVERMVTRSDLSWDSKENWDMWKEIITF